MTIVQNELIAVRPERNRLLHEVATLSTARDQAQQQLEATQQSLTAAHITTASVRKQADMLTEQLACSEENREKVESERQRILRELLAKQMVQTEERTETATKLV